MNARVHVCVDGTQVQDKMDQHHEVIQGKLDQHHQDTHGKLDQLLDLVTQPDTQPVLTHATIPPEVPELPAALQTRPALLDEMKQRVLSQASTTSVVGVSRGAAATTSAHGMVHTHPRALPVSDFRRDALP